MTKYVFNYHGDGDMPSDPAEIEAVMQAWSAWFGELGDAVVDGGNPFGPVASVASDGSVAHANPAQLTGYSIVNADSLDDAVAMAAGCPALGGGGSVSVSETIDM